MVSQKRKDRKYTSDKIRVLKGLEPVRLRPNMFIPDLGKEGLHHLTSELISNAMDEFSEGFGDRLQFFLDERWFGLRDFGRGIPFSKSGFNPFEEIFLRLHSGGKFDCEAYKRSGGTFGVGLGVVNALSKYLVALSVRSKTACLLSFVNSELVNRYFFECFCEDGTFVCFSPDPQFFTEEKFDLDLLYKRIGTLAFLNPKLRLEIFEGKKKQVFHGKRFDELPKFLGYKYEELFKFNTSEVSFELSVLISRSSSDVIEGVHYVNNIEVSDSPVLRVFRKIVSEQFKSSVNLYLPPSAVGGFLLFSNLQIDSRHLVFRGQSKKACTLSRELKPVLEERLRALFTSLFNRDFRSFFQLWVKEQKEAHKARARLREARKSLKKVDSDFVLPGKLCDCTSTRVYERELYLCEGESAGGSLKLARDRKFQAVMPVKGKTLNVFRGSSRKVLKNKELLDIFIALGGKVKGSKILIKRPRYGKIIIATDADSDGSHIQVLLLGFFFLYLRPFIEAGMLYIVETPLYIARKGSRKRFVFAGEDVEVSSGWNLTRFKGLGEMSVEQIRVILDPGVRKLKRVEIVDNEKAENLLLEVLGSSPEKRLEFIQRHTNLGVFRYV